MQHDYNISAVRVEEALLAGQMDVGDVTDNPDQERKRKEKGYK